MNRRCGWFRLKSLPSTRNFYWNLRFLASQSKSAFDTKDVSTTSLEPKYTPKDAESHWYDWWESKNYFKPTKSEDETFVILLPPPNVTGTLHLGHALTVTIQDVILRWKRMKGDSVLWVPGVDHAGIATQVAVEKYLNQSCGLSKHELGKEEFLKKVWGWKDEKEAQIIQQLKSLGASLDWSKLKFTLDPTHSQIVANAFIKLYSRGLIYRSESPVNWCCALRSSISDIEVEWRSIDGKTKINVPGYEKPVNFGIFYEFAYKVCDEDDEIVVSTTRPETMVADVAVAVHPDDPKYSRFKDKLVWHPFRQEKIPVIFDCFVDRSVGTGAVKVTPCHSLIDFEVGERHSLARVQGINEEGLTTAIGKNEKLHNLKRFDARSVVINELKALGLFRGYKELSTKVPICSRTGDVVEVILKNQWFLKTQQMAEKAKNAVTKGDLVLRPEGFNSVWMEWLNNIVDWNLSRQLWWGHPIPMYECRSHDAVEWIPALSLEEAKAKASRKFEGDVSVKRDPDVLDTWFSSGLLPLNISDEGLSKKSPISMIVTGHDILFFWVARMVMLGMELTGSLPFSAVCLHGLVCDSKGRKMSKSLGNVIRPEDVINGRTPSEMAAHLTNSLDLGLLSKTEFQIAVDSQKKMFPDGIPECGVDALRLTLLSSDVLSQFVNFDVKLCHASRHFCNKVWQAMKYFIKIVEESKTKCDLELLDSKAQPEIGSCFSRWVLSKLAAAVKASDEGIASHNFYLASQAIKLFFVEDFCSVFLESTKPLLREASPSDYKKILSVFFHCMETSLRLMSPFMPFLSEHLYQALPSFRGFRKEDSVTIAEYPSAARWEDHRDVDLEILFKDALNVLSSIRRTRTTYQLKNKPRVFIRCSDGVADLLLGSSGHIFCELAKVNHFARVANCNERNVVEEVLADDCVVYVEHEHDRNTLKKLLEPTINKEENLTKNLLKLRQTSSDELNVTAEDKTQLLKKINAIEGELIKISNFKRVIENCDR